MDQDYHLFKLLSDGAFHSGEDIAESFGVTRSRVWSLVNSLEDKGVIVSRVRGKGYRYTSGSELLNVTSLCEALSDLSIYYLPETTSTSDVAREYSKNNKDPFLVVSEYQTGGRGRRGRYWNSAYAHNLMFTYAVPDFESVKGLDGLSLVVGLSIAEFLKATYKIDAKVKWPNDIYINESKLGGILIELQGDISSAFGLLIGIGINVNQEPDIDDRKVCSLKTMSAASLDRTILLQGIIEKLKKDLMVFSNNGFSYFKTRWESCDCFEGRVISVERSGIPIVGKYIGVDDSGALKILIGDQIETIHAGEVSLRALDG